MNRWVIEGDGRPSRDQRAFWEREHLTRGYETTFSVGEDEEVMERVADAVLGVDVCRNILVAGCGSRTDLQQLLLKRAPALTELVAIDFPPVVAEAAKHFSHPRLTYASLEQASAWRQHFDV